MKTYVATPATRERNWLVVDANGQTLGRLATQIADALRGKRKPEYTPHCDTGDFVVVVNAEKIRVTGNKLNDKLYKFRFEGKRNYDQNPFAFYLSAMIWESNRDWDYYKLLATVPGDTAYPTAANSGCPLTK